jgi:hypothetical protein
MKTRLQFDFDDAGLELLEDLKFRLTAASRAEVVRRALRLMDLVQSGQLKVIDKDGISREVLLI